MHGHPHDPPDVADLASLTQTQQAFRALHQVMHAYRGLMTRKVGDCGSHPGQAIVLRVVAHNDGISQSELAKVLGLARPTVTIMLQKMEKAGIVERRTDERDQRVTRIYLSERGERMHEEMHVMLDAVMEEAMQGLSEKDRTELIRLLLALSDNMNIAARKGETA